MQLARYQCFKIVEAAKIVEVRDLHLATAWLVLESGGEIRVDAAYLGKHHPEAGGYFVRYGDGYESFSPAAAFEAGYTRIDDPLTLDPRP